MSERKKYTVAWYHPTVALYTTQIEANSEDEAIDIAKDDEDVNWEKISDDEFGLCNYCSSNDQYTVEE